MLGGLVHYTYTYPVILGMKQWFLKTICNMFAQFCGFSTQQAYTFFNYVHDFLKQLRLGDFKVGKCVFLMGKTRRGKKCEGKVILHLQQDHGMSSN